MAQIFGLKQAVRRACAVARTGFVPVLCGLALSSPAIGLELALPRGAQQKSSQTDPLARYALPIAAFDGTIVPNRIVEGAVTRTIWQIPQNTATTAQLFAGLRDQLTTQGYSPIFGCAARDCGGFDFRFGIEIADAPLMFVNLSDYRFASLSKGPETAVSLLVSAAAGTAYIQMVQIGPGSDSLATTIDLDPTLGPQGVIGSGLQIGVKLVQSGAAVLDDLEFATGASDLAELSFASLQALAVWLNAAPSARVALVGHTDAEGTLDGNIALSKRRAEAVRQRLIDRYGVNADQLTAEGIGYLAPRATNITPEGRTINRRVEVVLIAQ